MATTHEPTPTLCDARISVYKDVKDKIGTTHSFGKIATWIKNGSGEFADTVASVRAAETKDARTGLKLTLPGATFCGEFAERKRDKLEKHSGLICLDFDDVEDLVAKKEALSKDDHVVMAFVSPSGTGLKVILRVPDGVDHDHIFDECARYLKHYELEADKAASDVSRLCFLSHDPDAIINFDAEELPIMPPEIAQETRSSVPKTGDRIGDRYNACANVRDRSAAILEGLGWKLVHTVDDKTYYTRPGKKRGASGSLFDNGNFYCFTSNAAPLQPTESYSPFALYATANHAGDYSAAALALADEFGDKEPRLSGRDFYGKGEAVEDAVVTGKRSGSLIWDNVATFTDPIPYVDTDREPTPEDFKVFLKGQPIGEDGDLIATAARLKSYKTSVVNAIAAATAQDPDADTLGFRLKGKGTFLLFDTEQSDRDIQVQSQAIRKRLDLQKTPAEIKIVGLREHRKETRLSVIKTAIEEHAERGIIAVAIDGISDLAKSINDDEDAERVISFLLVAAKKADAPLFAVIHLNHSDRNGEGGGRGHLGKELERKAKTVIYIEKSKDDVGTIYCPATRRKPIPKKDGQRIAYDEDAGMVVSLNQTPDEIKTAEKDAELKATLLKVEEITGAKAWTRPDLIDEILEIERLAKGAKEKATKKTGNNRVNSMLDSGLLKVSQENGNLISLLDDGKRGEKSETYDFTSKKAV